MRSKLIAREIKRMKSDLIGVQEVAMRRDLKRLGLKYGVGSKQQEADIEAPIDAGHDVRLTMFDVTLVKKSKQLKVRSRFGSNYTDSISVPTPAGPLTSTRGWTGVDLTLKGKRLRFVNTHLEAFLDSTREAQAREFVGPNGPLRVSSS